MSKQTTRIGLLSDVHATPKPVREALQIFRDNAVETILCAGDIAGYGSKLEETIGLLSESNCRSIAGNHDLWHFERRDIDAEVRAADYLRSLPLSLTLEIADSRLMMTHASPPESVMDGIRLLDDEGRIIPLQKLLWRKKLSQLPADILVVGHTHQVFAEEFGSLLVINPGSTLFNHTCAILTLPEKSLRFYALSGENPVLSWNFSMFKGQL